MSVKTFFPLLFVSIFTFSFVELYAQGAFGETDPNSEAEIDKTMNKVIGEKEKPTGNAKNEAPIPGGVKPATKPMAAKFYTVRLFVQDNPIDTKHKAYLRFESKLSFKQIENVGYVYIIGSFSKKEEAMAFLQTLQTDFPDAKVVPDKENPMLEE